MTFEEFFKKKRIDLPALEKAEPALFSEFKTQFELMGEKSFDHTKKYWFNKLRRRYHLAPEIKPEKVAIANALAEQTITESLTEPVPAPPIARQGFVSRFKASNIPKPVVQEQKSEEKQPIAENPQKEKSEESSAPKPAYKPRFNMKNIPPKTGE